MKTIKRTLLFAVMFLSLSACDDITSHPDNEVTQQTFQWQLVTSWPRNFPGLGVAPERFAEQVAQMSGGRLSIKVYAAGELVPALEVFDAVSQGKVQMGHSAAYYWKDKAPAAQFFATVPFGMTAQEMNAWLRVGGGMELWREVYAPFGVVPLAGGNTGMQMGGWFNKEINSLADLKGLKMRLPGLGGEVLKRAGGVPVNLPGGKLFSALKTGEIDAVEWVGPYNDLALGLHKAATYYYYPGWHEPGTTIEFMVNQQALDSLPGDLRAIVEVAAAAVNAQMLDEYVANNLDAYKVLVDEHGVQLRQFPAEVLAGLKALSQQVIKEQVDSDPQVKRVFDAYQDFLSKVKDYNEISSKAYLDLRN